MRIKRFMLFVLLLTSFTFILIGCNDSSKNQDYKSDDKYALEITNGKRFFKSEVTPKSKAEEVILDSFKIQISDDYDNFKNVFMDSDMFNYYPETYKQQFDEGLYTEEIIVHSLNELNKDEYSNESNGLKYYFNLDKLKEYNADEIKIIEVVYTNKVTDKLDKIAQWGSGDWTRYYVVVKEKKDSTWKIYDVYGHM